LSYIENIREIFQYNTWANEQLIKNLSQIEYVDYIKPLPIPFKNLHGLLNHLYYYDAKSYHKIVDGNVSLIKEKGELSRELLFETILTYSKNWNQWIDKLIDKYDKDDKEKLEMNLELIFNLYAHNNYHRGQINSLISILGYQPKSLDVFLYKSQSAVHEKQR